MYVKLICPFPTLQEVTSITGYAGDGSAQKVQLEIVYGMAKLGSGPAALPYAGPMEGDFLLFDKLPIPPPPSPPSAPPSTPVVLYCASKTCGSSLLTQGGWKVFAEFGTMDRFSQGVVTPNQKVGELSSKGWTTGSSSTYNTFSKCIDLSDIYHGGDPTGFVEKELPQASGLTEVVVAFGDFYAGQPNTICSAVITDGEGKVAKFRAYDMSAYSNKDHCMGNAATVSGVAPSKYMTVVHTTVDLSGGKGKVRIEESGAGGNVAYMAYVLKRSTDTSVAFNPSVYCASKTCGSAAVAEGWTVFAEFGTMDRFSQGVVTPNQKVGELSSKGWTTGSSSTYNTFSKCIDLSDIYHGGDPTGFVEKELPQASGLTEVVVAFGDFYAGQPNTICSAVITDGEGKVAKFRAYDMSAYSNKDHCMGNAATVSGVAPSKYMTVVHTTVDLSGGKGKVRIEESGAGGNVAYMAYVLTRSLN